MFRTSQHGANLLLILQSREPPRRCISFASVINRGIRRTNDTSGRLGSSPRSRESNKEQTESLGPTPHSRLDINRRTQQSPKRFSRWRKNVSGLTKDEISQEAPAVKPYTTAGSEFLYGTFAVKAALEAKRRKFYKLYIWRGDRESQDSHDHAIHALAKAQRFPVQFVAGSWDKMLAKMSGQRPHNGYVLEASAIPQIPVITLQTLSHVDADLVAKPANQSLEDEAINDIFAEGSSGRIIPRSGEKTRYPLLLWLDRITDTGNLGAIMRTAHFMGVDAIIVPEHGTAPFSPITIKASAGAAEILPIMLVKKELDFVQMSQQNGWKFIAAVAPDSESTWKRLSQQGSFVAENALDTTPCVLMLGNEGEGLRAMMQKAADNFVSIRGVRGPADGVESLNVSVAAALLMARLLSKGSPARRADEPVPPRKGPPSSTDDARMF